MRRQLNLSQKKKKKRKNTPEKDLKKAKQSTRYKVQNAGFKNNQQT